MLPPDNFIIRFKKEDNVYDLECFDLEEKDNILLVNLFGHSEKISIPVDSINSIAFSETGEIINLKDALLVKTAERLTVDQIKNAKSFDRTMWGRKYKIDIIIKHFQERIFNQYDYKCFKCGLKEPEIYGYERYNKGIRIIDFLHKDHHIPISMGGKLEAGNITILCRKCNMSKRDLDPRCFYNYTEYSRIIRLLAQQEKILEFKFDWDQWNLNNKSYLASLGIEENLLEEVFANEDHRFAVRPSNNEATNSMTVYVNLAVALDYILTKDESLKQSMFEMSRNCGKNCGK